MKKQNLLPWITSIVVLLVLVINGNLPALGIAITVFISIFFFRIEKNIEKKCSEDAGHLIPHGNRLPLYILDLSLMATYVLSKPFNIGVITDVYYALIWGVSMGLIFMSTLGYWAGAKSWVTTKKIGNGTMHSPHNDETKKNLIAFYSFEMLIITSFVTLSFFGELEVTSILIITNQLFVTFFLKK